MSTTYDAESRQSRSKAGVISATFVALIFLLAKCAYYGGDIVSIASIALIVITWLVVLARFSEKYMEGYHEYSRVTALGARIGRTATIIIAVVSFPFFVSGRCIWIASGATTLSSPYLVAIPFIDRVDSVAKRYAYGGGQYNTDAVEFNIPIDSHRSLLVDVAANGFELDRSNPALEKMLLRRVYLSAHPGDDIDRELMQVIADATTAELKDWSLTRLDATSGSFVLTNGVGTRIINAQIAKMGLRWDDGTLSVSSHLQFSS